MAYRNAQLIVEENPGFDPGQNDAAAYMVVDDPDELAAEWSSIVGKRNVYDPVDNERTGYFGMHVDFDYNTIFFGWILDKYWK